MPVKKSVKAKTPAPKKAPAKKKPREKVISDEERQTWAELQDVACPQIIVPFSNFSAKAIKSLPDVLGVREILITETDEPAFAIPIHYMDEVRLNLLRAGKKIPY